MREGGGNCLKYLERGWNKKEGRGHKDKLGHGVGALKGGAETPLRTMISTVRVTNLRVRSTVRHVLSSWEDLL